MLPRSRLAVAGAAVAVVVVGVGVLVRGSGGGLGTATPPFVMAWGLAVTAWLLPAVVVLTALVAWGPALLTRPRSPLAFAAASLSVALAAGLAVNAVRHGPREGWWAIFDLGPGGSFEAANEYLPGLPAARYGTHVLLDRFDALVPSETVNVAGHPPGLLLLLHLTGITTPQGLAALCIAAAAAVAPLTYALARGAGLPEDRARVAALLAAASPALLLFGVTSADAVFAALGTAAAALLVRRGGARAAGCALVAVAAFFSWALLAVAAFAALLAAGREGVRPALVLAAGCALAVVAFDAALALAYGYDPVATLRATERVYRDSVSQVRPYAFYVLGSPVAFAVMLGLPTAAWWLAAGARRAPLALAGLAVVAIAAVLGFTKGETERIWLPFVPLACAGAAALVPPGRLRPVLGLLAVQALATEVAFSTIW